MNTVIEAEAVAIGSLAIYPNLFQHCILKHEYFTSGYKEIYQAMIDCYTKHNVIEPTSLVAYKGFDIDLYMKCTDTSITSNVERFIHLQKLIIDHYKERVIAYLTDKLNRNEIDLNEYDQKYRKVIDLHSTETSKITAQDFIQACSDNKKNITFQRFKNLERLLKLKENDFVIVAGATGGGKSGFALNLVDDLSVNYKCLYFNLEMVHEELLQRLVAINSNLTQDTVSRYYELSQEQMNRTHEAINAYAQRQIYIISQSQTLDTIRANIASNNTDKHMIVLIDHIGLIGVKGKSAYERMTDVAKELRKYSLDFNCTIIGLCQLNREATKTAGSPKLSMLRDSGEIEQSASKVLFVWNDEKGYSLVIEKNRSGSLGIVDINYNKASQRMDEII